MCLYVLSHTLVALLIYMCSATLTVRNETTHWLTHISVLLLKSSSVFQLHLKLLSLGCVSQKIAVSDFSVYNVPNCKRFESIDHVGIWITKWKVVLIWEILTELLVILRYRRLFTRTCASGVGICDVVSVSHAKLFCKCRQ